MSCARRNTKQKEVIYQELCRVRSHPSAAKVYLMAQRQLPHLSFATVYRNLKLLKCEGRVLELSCDPRQARYDADTSCHHHFFCIQCNQVYDYHASFDRAIKKVFKKQTAHAIHSYAISFYGLCAACKS
jgi:Fe2+ or Zn2+ uptake regulation protein